MSPTAVSIDDLLLISETCGSSLSEAQNLVCVALIVDGYGRLDDEQRMRRMRSDPGPTDPSLEE